MNLHEFCLEINRWLAVRWKTSDYFRNLPTMEMTLQYAQQVFDGKMQNIFRSTLVDDEALHGLTPESWAIHMLDLVLNQPRCCIDIVSYTMETVPESYLVRLKLNCEQMEMGDDKCFAVRSVFVEDPEQDEQEIGLLAITAAGQFDAGKLFERWMRAPEAYRRKHPICPVCGGAVSVTSFTEGEKTRYHMACSSCDWAEEKLSCYKDEALDAYINGGFKKARRSLAAKETAVAEMDALTGSVLKDLDVLKTFCEQKSNLRYQQEIAERLRTIEKCLSGVTAVVLNPWPRKK